MAGWSRVLGAERLFAPGAVACLVLGAGACLDFNQHSAPPSEAFAAGGALAVGGGGRAGFGAAGFSTGAAVGGAAPVPACVAPEVTGKAVFAEQMVNGAQLARREFFSWTTDEQAAELHQDRVLFSRTERSGMGPGYAFQVIENFAQDQSAPERQDLATRLAELFAKARYAWSEPWATRMGWPGEDYGGNLIRIVLKADAWVVVIKGGDLTVLDVQNQPVSLARALANPARVGAIFYQKEGLEGGPFCGGGGSFSSGSNGYREFILGNLAMVEEWSLATQQIRERLSANIEQLGAFLVRVRSCPITSSAQQWNVSVVCNWDAPQATATTELFAYEQALAIPSDNYLAVPERIATMIETLQGDLFELDPLVVTPGSP